jgi:hypothetical protein
MRERFDVFARRITNAVSDNVMRSWWMNETMSSSMKIRGQQRQDNVQITCFASISSVA